MNPITIDISDRKAVTFVADNCQLRNIILPFLVALLGEPLYVIKDGEVGSPRREIVVEPEPVTVPVPETVPSEPVPA